MSTRTITIYCIDQNDYTVQEGEAICDRLCWDEMLGTIVELTHPRIGAARYRMQTAEERELFEEQRAARFAELRVTEADTNKSMLDMLDTLRQWQASELLDDPQEHANARAERDRIIASLMGN